MQFGELDLAGHQQPPPDRRSRSSESHLDLINLGQRWDGSHDQDSTLLDCKIRRTSVRRILAAPSAQK